jgi:hypothetical protein
MALADASLLRLADETGLREIMAVDANDFSRYRLPDGRGITINPPTPPKALRGAPRARYPQGLTTGVLNPSK